MTNADGDLSKYREVAVVLGGGLRADDSPTAATLARADAAAELAKARDVALIVAGSHGDGPKPSVTEAEYMARRIAERGVPASRVFVEDQSRDTVSNAAYVAQRYLAGISPRRLIVVTSPFHMARSLETFRLVLGPAWPLDAYPSAAVTQDDAHVAAEKLYLGRMRARLKGLMPGDIPAIVERVRATMHQNVVDDTPRR